MSAAVIGCFAGIVLCIVFSGFFSSSEMAYSSCNRVRIENAKEDGNRKAGRAFKIISHFDDALSTILIGNNLVNIACSSLASVAVILLFGEEYTWAGTVVVTLAVIVFGETIPKITAKKNANRLCLRYSGTIRFLMVLFRPVTWPIVKLVELLTRGLKGEEKEELDDLARDELHTIIETAEDEEVIDEGESELVSAAIDFSEIPASEAMTARVDVLALDLEDDWEEILHTVEESPYTRIPVYQDSIDNIQGILSVNHFLKALTEQNPVDIRSLLLPAGYVYKTMKLPAVLTQLRNSHQHLAIVTDEFGGTLGVISMEDVLEKIVGDIWDETDTVEPDILEHDDGTYELSGDTPISDFLDLMHISPEDFDFESQTVGGWTIEVLDRFPVLGDSFTYENLLVKVLKTGNRRVERVWIRPLEKELEEKQKKKEKES
jgi:CBS domain containing-hemolysin-like protein